jgi:hypothetical protein
LSSRPTFDADGNGVMDTNELCAFLDARQSGRKGSGDMDQMSKKLRTDRIRSKTVFAKQIGDVGKQVHVRVLILM